MRKSLIVCIAITIGFQSFGQESERVFLNKKWEPTKETKAKIIRDITKINDTLFRVTESDMNNTMLMTGEYSSITPMIENGYFKFYDIKTKLQIAKGQYRNGVMIGNWVFYSGNSNKQINYDLDLKIKNDSSGIFVIVETMPKFQDKDLTAFREYISANLVYPPNPMKQGISGNSFVQFVVNKDGDVCNVNIVKSSLNKDLDREALRVISQSPKWTPAKQRGVPVDISFTFPIVFILQ